jgi:hypothetical protein
MEGKARFVFPVVITAIIVFVVSGAVTFFNIGHRLADRDQHRLCRDALRPQPHPAHRRGHRKDRLMLSALDLGRPLRNRIADCGNPTRQGQVSTLCRNSN